MAVNKFKFNLDIEKEDYIPKFKVKQYDTAIFYVNLFKNGTPFPIENQIIKIFVKKSDETILYQENEIYLEAGAIRINIKNQALTSPGMTYAELELKANDGQVTSATFLYEVKEKVGSDKAVESITDMSTLEKFDKYIEDSQKELDKFKNDLSKLEDLVVNKDKLEGQNTEAKVNIKELEKVLEDANNIVNDEGKKVVGNNVFSKGVTNGYVQDIKISGQSMVNEILSKEAFSGSSVTMYTRLKLAKGKLYSNKTYTYIPIGVPIKCTSMYLGSSDSTLIAVSNSPVKIKTFTLSRDALESELLPHFYGSGFTSNDFVNTQLLILEGDYTQNPPPYFEGIKSVGDGVDNIEINSCNLNAFNEDLLSSRLESDGYYHFRASGNTRCAAFMGFVDDRAQQITSMTPNLVTDLSEVNWEGCRFLIGLNGDKNDDKVLIPIGDIGYLNTRFFKGCESIIVDNNHIKFRNIELSYGKTSSSYIPHEQSKRKLLYYDPITKSWKKPIIKEWDTIEQHSNGKYYYHRRSFKEVLNGTQDTYLGTVVGDTTSFAITIGNSTPNNSTNIISDNSPVNLESYSQAVEGLFCSGKSITLRLKSSKAGDVWNCKDYLKRFPITLVCKMAQEEVYECLDISVRSFRDETLLSINSGQIDHRVEYYLPTGFVSADNSLSSKLENTDSELINLMFDYLAHNHDSRYPLKYAGDVTDFNTCLTEGTYSVGSTSDLPNAPYVDPGMGIYGTLEVLKKKNEYIQRFTSNICKMFVRFRNYAGVWSSWNRAISDKDFNECKNGRDNGYQVLPSGIILQWGSTVLPFVDHRVHGYLPYPIAYKEYVHCCGNVSANDYGGFCEATGSVAGDDLTRGYAEAQDVTGVNRNGKNVRFQWIAIGK